MNTVGYVNLCLVHSHIWNSCIVIYYLVLAAPKWNLPSDFNDTITMKAGTNESRAVPFIAHPQPSATLTFNGGKVRDASRVQPVLQDNMATFAVNQAERPDTGDYVMTLENAFGTTSLTVHVTVLDRPSPPENLQVTAMTAESGDITWQVPADDGGSEITGRISPLQFSNSRPPRKCT